MTAGKALRAAPQAIEKRGGVPRALAVVLLIVGLLTSGCRKRGTPVEIGNREQILHVGNGAEPRDLDPTTATSVTEANILYALFEGLVALAPDGKTVVPGAAERWDVSPDGKTYTFHLHPGLKWSNGDALTADDFLYSFRRIIEPTLGSEMAIYADWVAGAQDYREERTHDFNAVGFRAPDGLTFEITLRERAPFWLALIAQNPFYPVHRATIEKHDAYVRREGNWTRPGSLVGNGPFVLKEWHTNTAVVVARNPLYWDAAHVRLQGVVFHPIDNADTEEKAFRGGLLHVTRYLPAAKLDAYRHPPSPLLHADPLVSTKFVEINVGRPPFNDVRVRRAFALAVDRAALVRDVRRDGSRAADSLAVPGSGPPPGYTPRVRLATDPVRARAQSTEAGFPNGAGLPAVRLVFASSKQGDQTLVEAMQAMWQKELGVHVELVPQEEKVWLDTQRTKDYQLILYSWQDINDPVALLQLFLGQSPANYSNWASPDYDREFAAAGQAPTDAERWTHLQNADALLMDALPLIPLYHENQNYLVQTAVRGWQDNPLNWHPFNTMSLEPSAAH